MTDKVTLERIEKLHPKVRDEAKEIYKEICETLTGDVFCRFAMTLRTIEEQNALYAQGRTAPGKKITNAKGGLSYHNYGLAIDIVLVGKNGISYDVNKDFDDDKIADWQEVVTIFKQYGWEWGGDWNKFTDYPHFQKTFGHTVRRLLELTTKYKSVDENRYVLI
jgi:peptidoglycan L-alanyl-D-glutamate endopeptidase CwlK